MKITFGTIDTSTEKRASFRQVVTIEAEGHEWTFSCMSSDELIDSILSGVKSDVMSVQVAREALRQIVKAESDAPAGEAKGEKDHG